MPDLPKHLRVRRAEPYLPALRYDGVEDVPALVELGAAVTTSLNADGSFAYTAVRAPDGTWVALEPGDVVVAIETGRDRPVVALDPQTLAEQFDARPAISVENGLAVDDRQTTFVDTLPLPPGPFLLIATGPRDADQWEMQGLGAALQALVDRIVGRLGQDRVIGVVVLGDGQRLEALSEADLSRLQLRRLT